jgi:hypothetical protein
VVQHEAVGAVGPVGVRELVGAEEGPVDETGEEIARRRIARPETQGGGARVVAQGDPVAVKVPGAPVEAVEVVHRLAAEQDAAEQVEAGPGDREVAAVRVHPGWGIATAMVGPRGQTVGFPHASRAMRRSAEQPRFGLEEADFAARAASARTRHRNRKPNGSMRDRFARRRSRRWSAPSAVEPRRICRPRSRLKSMGYRVAGSAEPIFASAY